MIPLGLGGSFLLTAWWVFNALLCDRNRPELVIDWGSSGGGHVVPGDVMYRDQCWREHVVLGQVVDEFEIAPSPAPDASDELSDGPGQWEDLESLR